MTVYQMNPPQPPPEIQPEEKHRMTVPQIMLIVLALGFVVWYLVTTLTPESSPYATVMASTVGARYNGECLIVRDEAPYDAEGVTSINYVAEEGKTVDRNAAVCYVYSSGFSTREMTTLQDYRDQIKEYQIKLLNAEITTDIQMEKLESEVLTLAQEVRELIHGARGNMNNQEKALAAAIDNRQQYLKSKYSEDQRMTRLYDDELSQLQRINSWTKQYSALNTGIVSFYSDGYEYELNMNTYGNFSPDQIRSMIGGARPEQSVSMKGKTTIYRLVKDGHWVALMLIRDNNWNPVEGAKYELKLENFMDTTVEATVLGFTRTGGELVVQLGVEGPVEPVLYSRNCTGVLGDNVTSLMVPEKAIYVQDNMPGVVWMDGDYEIFIPVNVLDKRDGMVYISAIQQGVLYEGQIVRLF